MQILIRGGGRGGQRCRSENHDLSSQAIDSLYAAPSPHAVLLSGAHLQLNLHPSPRENNERVLTQLPTTWVHPQWALAQPVQKVSVKAQYLPGEIQRLSGTKGSRPIHLHPVELGHRDNLPGGWQSRHWTAGHPRRAEPVQLTPSPSCCQGSLLIGGAK